MNIATVDIFRYNLPLVEALGIKAHTLAARTGLILKLCDGDGAVGYGEVAPLPGVNRESLDGAMVKVIALAAELRGQPIPEGVEKLSGAFEQWLGPYTLPPSVRFGVELAVLDLLARARQVPLRRLIAEKAPDEVPVGGLLHGNLGEIRKKALFLKREGYTSVKLKVGRYDLADEIQETVWLRERLGDTMAMRVDGNRAWDFDTAITYARETADCDLDYIEEPLQDPRRLIEFASTVGVKLGLDETLYGLPLDRFAARPGLAAAILKPTALGLERTVLFARRAIECRVTPAISSTFESGLGLIALANVAAAIQLEGVPAGLDTYEWLDGDVFRDRPPLRRARLELPELDLYSGTLDERRLQRIDNGQ